MKKNNILMLSMIACVILQSFDIQSFQLSYGDYLTSCDVKHAFVTLDEGFDLLRDNKIKRNAQEFPTFEDFMIDMGKELQDDSDVQIIKNCENSFKQATNVMSIYMKNIFKDEFSKALSSCQSISDVQNPIFQYVIRNSSGFLKSRCLLWVNQLSREMSWSCLVVAAGRHNMSAVKFLVELGVDINESFNPYKRTALYNAVLYNSPEIVAFLIDQGADVNKVDFKGSSPLMAAVFHNYQDIAQKLIDAGADCFAQNIDGLTPLSIAHTKNYKNLESLLLSKELPEYIV
ncbi:ankyrin repeat domain-containing protein [Candidatus Chromulinivorax destructor]|uniref:Uncharacterized protein n=1 Tax=Candidatus Chromulinivorax destructor TaxID=2066483 RepID=A0A345ZAG7_9BACT|nr:ankyrin repeat domain-containing protein [Candidatus Chromulinivorax destructor]AXK60284.1 hypothetical protein C0J27_00765 [Candidatus Chromulinivorax destructor]